MKKIIIRKKVEEGFADKAGAFGRGFADKATFGGYKYARAAADYGIKSGLKKLGVKGGEDTSYERELEQEKEKLSKDAEKEPLASAAGDIAGHAMPYVPVVGGAIQAAKDVVDKVKGYGEKAAPVAAKIQKGIEEEADDNISKISDIANQFKAMASEPKVGIKKLPDVNAPGVPDMFKVKKKIEEEGNTAGGGAIAGLGVGPQGEPGVSKKNQKKHQSRNLNMFRRGQPAALQEAKMGKFAGHDTFIVSSDKYHTAKNEKKKGKHWKNYIGEDECGMQIREYANKNHKKPIILQDESTGAMCYARYGKK